MATKQETWVKLLSYFHNVTEPIATDGIQVVIQQMRQHGPRQSKLTALATVFACLARVVRTVLKTYIRNQ